MPESRRERVAGVDLAEAELHESNIVVHYVRTTEGLR